MVSAAATAAPASRYLGRPVPDWPLVEDEASALLSRYAVFEPPVPLEEMVAGEDLSIRFGDFPDDQSSIAGFIRLPERRIYVNAADVPRRQKFTIAHELGHWLLHRRLLGSHPELYRVLHRGGPIGGTDPLEKEANGFAGRLLAPRTLLDRYWRHATVRPSASTLARIFAVSEDVIRYRLKFEYRHEA